MCLSTIPIFLLISQMMLLAMLIYRMPFSIRTLCFDHQEGQKKVSLKFLSLKKMMEYLILGRFLFTNFLTNKLHYEAKLCTLLILSGFHN